MKVLIAGSSGLLGTALCGALALTGTQVYRLERTKSSNHPNSIFWDPEKDELDPIMIEGFDVIINLAGENIFGRWSSNKKHKILESRVQTTSLLAKTIAELDSPPELFLNASAIGYYGDRGIELLTESSPAGEGFLADVCKQWELAAEPAKEQTKVRCAIIRIGIVLSPQGGSLKTMLVPFKLGLGGQIGSGEQYMSWISIDDVLGAIFYIIQHKNCAGVFNLSAPEPVTNHDFTTTLGKVLNRPTFLPFPTSPARLVFGEMVDALLLSSTRVEPKKLVENGYKFLYQNLERALRHLLSKD
ncbi:MAG: TIGR01777 family protein [Parachlamydiaceae bacterium]|nr:TIGR01777 family protein [Parachlamydiaceae bacterium]